MKKVIALLMVCGFAFAFVACGAKKEATAETTTPVADSTAVAADTTMTDSAAVK